MAIRSNYNVLMPSKQRVRTNRWKAFNRVFSDDKSEVRYIQEIIFGQRRDWRYWTITTDPEQLPENSTYYVMSHLSQSLDKEIGNLYGLRTWIEYGFKQCKNHLGWADFRVTHYDQIERWWEVVESAYLMVSLQFNGLASDSNLNIAPTQADLLNKFTQHPYWSKMSGWKHRLNNLQLIIQPYIYYCLIKPWFKMFDSWYLRVGFSWLIEIMNEFIGYVPTKMKHDYYYFSSA